jgi:hypothetical protein
MEPEQVRPCNKELGVNETIAGSTSGTCKWCHLRASMRGWLAHSWQAAHANGVTCVRPCEVGWRTAGKLASALPVHDLCVVLTLSLIITRKAHTLSTLAARTQTRHTRVSLRRPCRRLSSAATGLIS